MDEVLYHKFTQHIDLRAELLATGDAELVEVCHLSTTKVMIDIVDRTRTRTRSGVSEPMAKVSTSSEKDWRG
jgi:hypothetical protein